MFGNVFVENKNLKTPVRGQLAHYLPITFRKSPLWNVADLFGQAEMQISYYKLNE